MGRPKGSRTKFSGQGLADLLPLAKRRLKDALENGTRQEALEAVKIVTKYTMVEGHSLTHSIAPLSEEYFGDVTSRFFAKDQDSARTVN